MLEKLADYVNWLDVIVVIILIRTSYIGYSESILTGLFKALGILAALVVAEYNRAILVKIISKYVAVNPAVLEFLIFLIILLLVILVFKLLRGLLGILLERRIFGSLEGILGGCVGLFRGIILSGLILMLLTMLPFGNMDLAVRGGSFSGNKVLKITDTVYRWLERFYPFKIEDEGSKARHNRLRPRNR